MQRSSTEPCWAFFLPWELTDRGGVNQVVLHLLAECDCPSLLIEGNWEAPGETVRFGHRTLRERVRDPIAGGLLRYLLRAGDTIGRLIPLIRRNRIAVINAHFPGNRSDHVPVAAAMVRVPGGPVVSWFRYTGGDWQPRAEALGVSLDAASG